MNTLGKVFDGVKVGSYQTTPGRKVRLGSMSSPSSPFAFLISNAEITIAKDINKELSTRCFPRQTLRPYPNTNEDGSSSGDLPLSVRNLSGLKENGSA